MGSEATPGPAAWPEVVLLIVDDDLYARTMIAKQAQRIGIGKVVEADNGRTGLAAAEANRPHLVLCDLNMPEMDGAQFLAALRGHADPGLRAVPVIIVSAEASLPEGAIEAGAAPDGYMKKPVVFAALKSELARRFGIQG
jgi:two-component system chemotaxis response regulator CheY